MATINSIINKYRTALSNENKESELIKLYSETITLLEELKLRREFMDTLKATIHVHEGTVKQRVTLLKKLKGREE